jgi:predicted nucleic acid-binding protein
LGLSRAGIIPVDENVIRANARIRDACRRIGHPLHDKVHAGDLWIAASSLAHELPLVTDDRIFVGVPGLTIIQEEA